MPPSHLKKMRVNVRDTAIHLGASPVHCIPFCARDWKYRENDGSPLLIREQKSRVMVNNVHVLSNQESAQILYFTELSKNSIKGIVL